jgi:molybdate transport repressor ModE-like protein
MNSIDELEWDDLRYFLAVADTGSFNQAAAKLGVSYSTVTRRVSSLEERLGVRLFDRNRGGHDLTAAAEEMADVARKVEGEIQSLGRHLFGRDQRLSGRLRIATAEMLALTYMQDLAAFRLEYPDIEIDLVSTAEQADLSAREADIALRMGNSPAENLVGRRLGVLPVALYASEGYLSRHPADVDPSKHTWVSWDLGFTQMPTHAWMRKHAPNAKVALRVNSGTTLLAAVKAGLGVSHLFCSMGDAQEDLRQIQPPDPELETALWILTHDDLRTTARVRAFLDFMAKRIRRRTDPIETTLFATEG